MTTVLSKTLLIFIFSSRESEENLIVFKYCTLTQLEFENSAILAREIKITWTYPLTKREVHTLFVHIGEFKRSNVNGCGEQRVRTAKVPPIRFHSLKVNGKLHTTIIVHKSNKNSLYFVSAPVSLSYVLRYARGVANLILLNGLDIYCTLNILHLPHCKINWDGSQ